MPAGERLIVRSAAAQKVVRDARPLSPCAIANSLRFDLRPILQLAKTIRELATTILQLAVQRHDHLFLQRRQRPAGSLQASQRHATAADEPDL